MAKKKKAFTTSMIGDMITSISDDTGLLLSEENEIEFISTGVHILDAQLSKNINTGGVASDRITIFAGPPGTGKSYIMYNVARDAQSKGYLVLFIDTEHSVNKHILSDFGIEVTPDKLQLINSNNVEQLKFFLTKFLDELKTAKKDGQEIPKIMIVLDSIGQLASEKEKNDALEGKNKQDMTRAKAIKQLFRIINSDLGYLGIPMVASNHTYEDVTSFYPVPVMAGGKGVEYSASTIIFLSTAKLKTGREDELDMNSTGVIVTAQAKKNRMAKPKKVKFEIDYSYGTNKYKGLEYFCTPENFDVIGIAKGKKLENEDGTIGITPGGTRWYVKHLDKSFFEKQMYNSSVFTPEVLNALEPIIYKYFDYSSFDDQINNFNQMDEPIVDDPDSDFDELDEDSLFS